MTFRRNSATVLLDQIRQPMVVSLCEEIVKKLIALFFILFALLPASVFAQGITQQKLRFAPGKTQTTISGEIAGRQTIDYVVGAKRGQTMSIKFSPSNRFAFFNLLAPGTGEALFVGQDQGNPGRFTARLGTTGNYIIRVYLVRAAARRGETSDYNLTVAINSVAPPPPAGDFADGDAGGPDFWVVYGLTAGDRLNMRRGPSAAERVIATFPSGKILKNLGCRRTEAQRWCKVQNPSAPLQTGWVNGRFLRESGAPNSNVRPGDALVPGTNYHATGEVDCAIAGYPSVRRCEFGVTRGEQGIATVFITLPDGDKRVLGFDNGQVRPLSGVTAFRFRQSGDSYFINVNEGQERFTIFDAVINGG
jgi:hypothetical protein